MNGIQIEVNRVLQLLGMKEIEMQLLRERIAELEAQLRWRPVSEGNLPATNVKVEKTKQCRSFHGTGTVWLMGSIHGEDVCEKCGGVGWIEVQHE